MEEVKLLESVERYVRGEMNPEEKKQLEELRRSNSEVDQMVVEQTMFLAQLNHFGEWKNFKSELNEVHHQLTDSGVIVTPAPQTLVVELWRKYKRVMVVAATIAGLTTLLIATSVSYVSRQANKSELEQLRREFKQEVANKKKEVLNEVAKKIESKAPRNLKPKSGGTSFLIDGKGFLVTNAHVVNNANTVIVSNSAGDEFRVEVTYIDPITDIAILKIMDEDFKYVNNIPYSIRKSGAELGEQLFTLGYPRNEIVYNEGYMSAKTGFDGDTMTCQIGVPANPGNSGGPVFNKSGEVVGIINTRLASAEGVVFAVTSKNIIKALETVKKEDTALKNLKLTTHSSLKRMDRPSQIRMIEDYVYMVKTY
jgi:S1-C subfamily serine protease